jgi:cytochrome c
MRHFLFVIVALLILQSCGKKDDSQIIERGRLLVDTNDCKTCHHVTNKIMGPAHLDVAKKYETTTANTEMIAKRIIEGGSGIWGRLPMTPHTDLSQEDAQAMARYILSLDE